MFYFQIDRKVTYNIYCVCSVVGIVGEWFNKNYVLSKKTFKSHKKTQEVLPLLSGVLTDHNVPCGLAPSGRCSAVITVAEQHNKPNLLSKMTWQRFKSLVVFLLCLFFKWKLGSWHEISFIVFFILSLVVWAVVWMVWTSNCSQPTMNLFHHLLIFQNKSSNMSNTDEHFLQLLFLFLYYLLVCSPYLIYLFFLNHSLLFHLFTVSTLYLFIIYFLAKHILVKEIRVNIWKAWPFSVFDNERGGRGLSEKQRNKKNGGDESVKMET